MRRPGICAFCMFLAGSAFADADGREVQEHRDPGAGYSTVALGVDLAATATTFGTALAVVRATSATNVAIAFAFAPLGPVFAAPIDHAAHGRGLEALASFFSWGLIEAVSIFSTGMLLAIGCTDSSGGTCEAPAGRIAAAFLVTGALTSIGTMLDMRAAWRTAPPPRRAHVTPLVWPTPGGGGLGVGGAF